MKTDFIKPGLAFLATVLVIAAGFFMPQFTESIQDKKIVAQTQNEKYDNVTDNDSSMSFIDKLNLASSNYSSFSLESVSEKDKEEAAEKVKNGLTELLAGETVPEKIEFESVIVAIANKEFGKSAVLWFFNTVNSDSSESDVILDGESGKILSFTCVHANKQFSYSFVDGGIKQGAPVFAETLAKKYSDYAKIELDFFPAAKKEMDVYFAQYFDGTSATMVEISVDSFSYTFNASVQESSQMMVN